MDGVPATAPEVEEAERRIAHVPLVLKPAQFQLADTAHFRRNRTTRAAVVVGVFHDYCEHRNVWTFLHWLSDLHRRRHMGKSDPGRLGLGHHQLRFLDRYRTRRHTDLSDLVFASPKVAYARSIVPQRR